MEMNLRAVKPGSVIAVERNTYEHFAIYAGDGEVIHYSTRARENILTGNAVIHRAGLSEFLDGEDHFCVPYLPATEVDAQMLWRSHLRERTLPQEIIDSLTGMYARSEWEHFAVCTAEETLRRAKTRIGEKCYNLGLNNCEHFALWCKFKTQISNQVSRVYEFLKTLVLKLISQQQYTRYVVC